MSGEAGAAGSDRRAYEEERAYWLRAAAGHAEEADLPFLRWHRSELRRRFALPAGELVCEVGAGHGKLLSGLDRVLLVDFSPEVLVRARAENPRYLAVCASVDALPFRDGALGHVVANNMLHHVKGEGLLDRAVAELGRALRADGTLYVNDRNPTLAHHALLAVAMAAKRLLRRAFGEFPGCGSFNEPPFTRRDWARIEARFVPVRRGHYYTLFMWAIDSWAKGLAVLLGASDRSRVARWQRRALPALLWLERHLGRRALCLEQAVVYRPRPGG